MKSCTFVAHGLTGTDNLGQELADRLPDGTVVALCGTLGAGKTRLVQAIAAACGVPREDVRSPTFVLCQEYHGRRTIYHLDVYRLKDEDEFLQLGPEEYFESDGLSFVEWADRVADCLPPERIEIHIDVSGEDERTFRLRAVGERFEPTITAIDQGLRRRTPPSL